MPKYKGDAYLRLSYSADRSVESDSIANQKKLIEDFVAMVTAVFCSTAQPSRK